MRPLPRPPPARPTPPAVAPSRLHSRRWNDAVASGESSDHEAFVRGAFRSLALDPRGRGILGSKASHDAYNAAKEYGMAVLAGTAEPPAGVDASIPLPLRLAALEVLMPLFGAFMVVRLRGKAPLAIQFIDSCIKIVEPWLAVPAPSPIHGALSAVSEGAAPTQVLALALAARAQVGGRGRRRS